MGKLNKIFLIYSDKDNSTPVHEEYGWVDAFLLFLKVLLKQIAGWEISYETVNGLSDIKKLPENYLFLIISSRNLVDDAEKLILLQQLKDKMDKGEISDDNILKIQKHYFSKELEPDFFHQFKDYSFYKANGLAEARSEYKDFFSNNEEKTFWVKLTDLAYEILSFSEKKGTGHLDISEYAVFLADTNTTSERFRNNLKRELESIGLSVLPKSSFSESSQDFILKLDQYVKNSDFAIHIIGNGFSTNIKGTNHTREEVQAKITENYSSLYSKENDGAMYRRFFWFDKVGVLTNEKIGKFYKELSVKIEDMHGTELVVSSWEEFKSLIYHFTSFELSQVKSPGKKVSKEDEQKIIYFLYERVDEKHALPIIKNLRNKGFNVITSNFDGDILAVRHIHMESLKRFDYAFIFSHKASIQWINMKMLDVFKAPGFGREKPILQKVLIIPNDLDGELIPTYKMFDIIRYDGSPNEDIISKTLFN